MSKLIFLISIIIASGNAYSSEYEDSVDAIETRLKYHKRVLEDYENKPYVYGRFGMDIQSHTKANIRYYEKLLEDAIVNQSRSNLH